MGNNSDVVNGTCYTLERSAVWARYHYPVSNKISFGFIVGYDAVYIFDGEDDDSESRLSEITDLFGLQPSVFRPTSVAHVGVNYLFDTRRTMGRISWGFYGEMMADYFRGIGHEEKPEFCDFRRRPVGISICSTTGSLPSRVLFSGCGTGRMKRHCRFTISAGWAGAMIYGDSEGIAWLIKMRYWFRWNIAIRFGQLLMHLSF